jgi:hypothetical protein
MSLRSLRSAPLGGQSRTVTLSNWLKLLPGSSLLNHTPRARHLGGAFLIALVSEPSPSHPQNMEYLSQVEGTLVALHHYEVGTPCGTLPHPHPHSLALKYLLCSKVET